MSEASPDYQSISVLIQTSKAGDIEAQANLLSQLQDYVRLMAEKHLEPSLRQKAGFSDIAQATMTRVVECFDQFNGETAAEFRGWLKTIVVNEIQWTRRTFKAAKRDIAKEREIDQDPKTGQFGRAPIDTNPTPSTNAIAREQVETFHRILNELPEDYATVIQLRSIENLPFKDVADRMERSHDSVTKLWYRAAIKLEEKMREYGVQI